MTSQRPIAATDTTSRSREIAERARAHLAGGVSAAARMHGALGRPLIVERAKGSRLFDADGREYIDMILSYGACILGHGHPGVREAIDRALANGAPASYEGEQHGRLAERICELVPCAETVRLASSGTEATLFALRLARAATGRNTMLKFEGHYHGLHDTAVWNMRGARRDSLPTWPFVPTVADSAGVPPELAQSILVVEWNDETAFRAAMAERGDELAAVICEPVMFNAGCIPPQPGFLEAVREECTHHGAVLIFDEVLTGFRMGLGGAQAHYAVTPDVCTLAKAIANGLPLAAIAGRRDLMAHFTPTGPAAHSGTYAGHPLSVAAAHATLDALTAPGFYDHLNARADRLCRGIETAFARHGHACRVQNVGARFGIFPGASDPVESYQQALAIDSDLALGFVRGCIERGVFLSYGSRGLAHQGISAAHTDEDVDAVVDVVDRSLGSA
jgi:glutamate-1-semialdehyde 2,1-aminomutase